MYRVIKFNQESGLKSYIHRNTELGKNGKNNFENDFFELMNNAVFGKTMENIRNHRYIKLITREARRNYLVSETIFHTTKKFSDNLLAIEMERTQILMNESVCLGLSILEISKIVICQFWYNYVKPKYREKAKLCYMDTYSFLVYIKREDIYSDIEKDIETRFDTSNDELDRPLPKGTNEKVIRLMKDELSGKIRTDFAVLRPKTYTCLADDNDDHKKRRTNVFHKTKT